jgi:hypothetical protein
MAPLSNNEDTFLGSMHYAAIAIQRARANEDCCLVGQQYPAVDTILEPTTKPAWFRIHRKRIGHGLDHADRGHGLASEVLKMDNTMSPFEWKEVLEEEKR